MAVHHWVRVGKQGSVGRFTAVDAVVYPRAARVIVRTARGLEIGEVLAPPAAEPAGAQAEGSIVRRMTVEDELLAERLERNKEQALAACERQLAERALPDVLLDVETLFDGRTLLFYFLGQVSPAAEALTSQLAEAYEAHAQVRRFAETLTQGCGPGCGTAEAAGGGCTSCGTGCAVAGACGVRAKSN